MEARQERNQKLFIPNQQRSIYKYTYSEELSQEYGTSLVKDDHKHVTKSILYKEKPSKWYPMQRCRLQTYHQVSGERGAESERENITVTKRTTK